MASKPPLVRDERRIPRVRTSVSLPEDVVQWLKWRANSSGHTVSGVIADAVRRLARESEGIDAGD